MFSVIVTSAKGHPIREDLFTSLPEAQYYFNRLVQHKSSRQALIRLVEKQDDRLRFLLDTNIGK